MGFLQTFPTDPMDTRGCSSTTYITIVVAVVSSQLLDFMREDCHSFVVAIFKNNPSCTPQVGKKDVFLMFYTTRPMMKYSLMSSSYPIVGEVSVNFQLHLHYVLPYIPFDHIHHNFLPVYWMTIIHYYQSCQPRHANLLTSRDPIIFQELFSVQSLLVS